MPDPASVRPRRRPHRGSYALSETLNIHKPTSNWSNLELFRWKRMCMTLVEGISILISIIGLAIIIVELYSLWRQTKENTRTNQISIEFQTMQLLNEYGEAIEIEKIENENEFTIKDQVGIIKILNLLESAIVCIKGCSTEDRGTFTSRVYSLVLYYLTVFHFMFYRNKEKPLFLRPFSKLEDYLAQHFEGTLLPHYKSISEDLGEVTPETTLSRLYSKVLTRSHRDALLPKKKKRQRNKR